MAKHEKPVAINTREWLQAVRSWSITLGISAFLLTVMYTAAVMHYGAPHFGDPDSVVSELSRTNS